MINYTMLTALTIALLSPAHAAETLDITLKSPAGKTLGVARLTQLEQGVKVELMDVKLSPGTKAIHFHEKGTCTPPGFDSAGSHYAPKSHDHGFNAPKGHHAGDMPNLVVGKSGVISAEIINTKVTLASGGNSLRKKGGTALIIHAGADDHVSQPSGNAGDRIACGEIPER